MRIHRPRNNADVAKYGDAADHCSMTVLIRSRIRGTQDRFFVADIASK
jgi:hypothetical protein